MKYRPEIAGLRAVAVISVVINHFNNDFLPSGYLGVDIFFVISGYVITASLYETSDRNFSEFFLGFYSRRVKRIAAMVWLVEHFGLRGVVPTAMIILLWGLVALGVAVFSYRWLERPPMVWMDGVLHPESTSRPIAVV
jgi:peptidoglycan/LPS O-acetylase OafA/YrhL